MSKRIASATLFAMLVAGLFAGVLWIEQVKADGTICIRADGSIDPPTAPIFTTDKVTYTLTGNITEDSTNGIVIQRNNAMLEGAGFAITGKALANSSGIVLDRAGNVTVKNVSVESFRNGIYGNMSTGSHITDTSLMFNDYGIYLASSQFNTIDGNNISQNAWAGIYLDISQNNNITKNRLANSIANNFGGIVLHDLSNNNNILENCLTANKRYGVYIENCWSNTIYHNNFTDNLFQAYVDPFTSQTNKWDNGYPSGGNYWNDYVGTDFWSGPFQNESGSDGIGDSPYVINMNNTDRYPLMAPWHLLSGHDVAVAKVKPSKTIVGKGYSTSITIVIANYGVFGETFNTTAYSANSTYETTIYIQSISLVNGTARTITFAWNTTNCAYGNYTISALADTVSGETNTADNNCTCDIPVHVGVPGDVSSAVLGVYDRRVDMRDIAYLISLFNTTPAKPNWDPNADVNNDGVVNMKDIAIAVYYFNQHE